MAELSCRLLTGYIDEDEYKHVVMGFIFLKYMSDSFQARNDDLVAKRRKEFTNPEARNEYATAV